MTDVVEAFIVAAIVALVAAPHLKAGLAAFRVLIPVRRGEEGRRST